MRNSLFVVGLAILPCALASAQTSSLQSAGTAQAVGLFVQSCIRLEGNPSAVRDFLHSRHVPELNSQGRAIFLQDHVGVGFDATNKTTRMAVVSEDNGVCSVFAETVDTSTIVSSLQAVFDKAHLELSDTGHRKEGALVSSFFTLKVRGHLYKLVVSTGDDSKASIHAIMTLAPAG